MQIESYNYFMNFVVYKTNTLKAAKNRIEELLKAVSRSDIDSPHIVIVPDRASLAAERSMLAQWEEASIYRFLPSTDTRGLSHPRP